jgi:hypothetical protein
MTLLETLSYYKNTKSNGGVVDMMELATANATEMVSILSQICVCTCRGMQHHL